jgi:hypothetical protein
VSALAVVRMRGLKRRAAVLVLGASARRLKMGRGRGSARRLSSSRAGIGEAVADTGTTSHLSPRMEARGEHGEPCAGRGRGCVCQSGWSTVVVGVKVPVYVLVLFRVCASW